MRNRGGKITQKSVAAGEGGGVHNGRTDEADAAGAGEGRLVEGGHSHLTAATSSPPP